MYESKNCLNLRLIPFLSPDEAQHLIRDSINSPLQSFPPSLYSASPLVALITQSSICDYGKTLFICGLYCAINLSM